MITVNQQKVLTYINSNDNLKNLFTYYLNNCITLCNPYHNINHTMAMCYHICCIYEESNNGKYDFVIDDQGLYLLLSAAIFHDYNHSAGRYTDNVNVETACNCMDNYFTSEFINEDKDKINKIKDVIRDIIKATSYPYIIETKELNLYQLIIREIDIIVSFTNDYFTQRLIGLKDELRNNDWNDLLVKEVKFQIESWKNMKLEYSINIVNEYKDELLQIIDTLIKIIKENAI